MTGHEIFDITIVEFNYWLEKSNFTEEQKVILRSMRRKGKNRISAMNSRMKRINKIENLKSSLEHKKQILADLQREHSEYTTWNNNLQALLEMAKEHRSLSDVNGSGIKE